MVVSFNLEVVDNLDNRGSDVIACCYYPHEGNTIRIVKGLSYAEVKTALCHEIAHLIDWYMSGGVQSDKIEIREQIAQTIGCTLEVKVDKMNEVNHD